MIRLLKSIAYIFIAGALAAGACAGEGMSRQQPMKPWRTITLPFVPGGVLFRPGSEVFVAVSVSDRSPETMIAAFDAEDTSKVFQFSTPHSVDAMTFSKDGDWLFLVGESNGEGYASRVRMPDAGERSLEITTIKLANRPVMASVAAGGEGTIYIGDATSDRFVAVPSSAFDGAASRYFDSAKLETQPFSWGQGVHALAVSEALSLAFVSYESLPKISALRLLGPTRVVDEFVRSSGKENLYSDRPIPLALLMTEGRGREGTASLLIGDHPSLTLTVVDFDPLFNRMNIIAIAPLRIRIAPKADLQLDLVTKLVKQPILIGCDNGAKTILVGDLYSTQLVQFTRDDVTLERIGEIEIPGAPSSISVSSDGRAAVAAIANSHDVQILVPGGLISDAPDAEIRQLQRELSALGLNVGIDGVIGKGTIAALSAFNSATGFKVSVKDINRAVAAMREVRDKCGNSGLKCLLYNKQNN